MPDRERKPLDRWARDAGYSDFDVYLAAGNSILDARREIARTISELELALRSLDNYARPTQPPDPHADPQHVGENIQPTPRETLVFSSLPEEPSDPHNAHPQGDDAV